MAGLSIRDLTHWMIPRMVLAGCNITDIERALCSITSHDMWPQQWGEVAADYLERAKKAEEKGHEETAYKMYFYAMIYLYEGQKFLFEDSSRKSKLYQNMLDVYKKVLAYAPYHIERVDIDHNGTTVPGVLHKPTIDGTYPCLIFMQGSMDSSKEEWHIWGQYAVERGFALLIVDTPGHAETRVINNVHLDIANVVKASTSCRKYLESRRDIISDKIGVLGNCLGSNYAFQAAANNPEFACCLILLTIGEFKIKTGEDDVPAWLLDMIKFFTGENAGKVGAYNKYIEDFNLNRIPNKVQCPTHLFHSKRDNWVAWEQVDVMGSHVEGPLSITAIEGDPAFKGNPASHLIPIYEQIHWVMPEAFDWVKEQLCAV